MAASKTVIWFFLAGMLHFVASKNILQISSSFEYRKICTSMYCKSIEMLMELRNCTVVLGDLKVVLMERTTREDFANVSFPELREVTGSMIVYRVRGLESIGKLFPNLARIRGTELVFDYALIIYDLPDLLEIGMYGLLKIDRGGIIVWGGVYTCYMDTVYWEAITNGRRVIFPPENSRHCNFICSCSLNRTTNFCWNNRKCQRFLEGPAAESCDNQCFGCKKTSSYNCSLCRFYTHRGHCVSKCPNGTISLEVNKYCLTEEECKDLGGWSWRNFCVLECPQNYIKWNTANGTTCKRCDTCHKTCASLVIQTLANIQSAQNCMYINGSLTIHIRSIMPEALDEMRHYLSAIREVSDYIFIYGSLSITSLDFLSSLQRIRGRNLQNGKYSLIVSKMYNLQTLFTSEVTQNLTVDKGVIRMYDNPMLCINQINKLRKKFPDASSNIDIDIPPGLNGYNGACDEISLQLRVEVKNETSVIAIFNRFSHDDVHYSILYVRIPLGKYSTVVPESCSELEWDAINVPSSKLYNKTVHVQISSLRPASRYALCIETYDPARNHLARSAIVNFNTTVGRPEPSFITELVASSSEEVVIRWVDHKDYRPYIHHYELDVNLVEINPIDIAARDHCIPVIDDPQEFDYSRHAVVMRPPKNYEKGCESMCGVLSTVTAGAMTEDFFDVCSSLQSECDDYDDLARLNNSTFGNYVKTLVINISSPRTDFQIGDLAPFRDYRFKLRACTNEKCSRPRRSIVRTLRLKNADEPNINCVRASSSGDIFVEWLPPKVTNGPVLAYSIEILPILPEMEKLIPQIWCVPANITNVTVKYDVAKTYRVRICSTTLGSNYVCSDSRITTVSSASPRNIIEKSVSWWLLGIPFGVVIYIASMIVGLLNKRNKKTSDEISLVDSTSMYGNESEPPCQIMPEN